MAGYLSLPSFSTATTTNATRCRAFNGLSSTSSSLIAYPRCPGLLKGVKLSQSSSLSAVAADVSASTDSPRKKVYFDEEEESEEEVRKGYEALYGPAFSGIRTREKVRRRGRGEERDPFQERVVQIRRVTKVVKGGKQLSFRAIVIVGDKRGRVGVGVGSAKEVVTAVQKSAADARRHVINVPMTKYRTFPHRADGKFGAALVMLRPAATGTGVIAGGSVRVVLEMAGIENALGKEIGSKNALNNARAVLDAVSKMKQFSDVARDRGIPMEELWK